MNDYRDAVAGQANIQLDSGSAVLQSPLKSGQGIFRSQGRSAAVADYQWRSFRDRVWQAKWKWLCLVARPGIISWRLCVKPSPRTGKTQKLSREGAKAQSLNRRASCEALFQGRAFSVAVANSLQFDIKSAYVDFQLRLYGQPAAILSDPD